MIAQNFQNQAGDLMNKTESKVFELISQKAAESGITIYCVEFVKEGPTWVLRIYIDKDEVGVSLTDCENFSRMAGDILDEANVIESNYMLEVSSPGIERKLSEPWHFEKYTGSEVTVKLFSPIGGKKQFTGVLLKHNPAVEIDCGGEILTFENKNIASVNLHYKF